MVTMDYFDMFPHMLLQTDGGSLCVCFRLRLTANDDSIVCGREAQVKKTPQSSNIEAIPYNPARYPPVY